MKQDKLQDVRIDLEEGVANLEEMASNSLAGRTSKGSKRKGASSASPQTTKGLLSGGRATPAEKMRERKLLDDKLANLLSPQLVECKRCSAHIKLSVKSAYDPFHWQKHRERCLKRPEAVVQGLRESNEKPQQSTAEESKLEPCVPVSPQRRISLTSSTPPLTPDNDESRSVRSVAKEESPSPQLSSPETLHSEAVELEQSYSPQTPTPARRYLESQAHPALIRYLSRSHRGSSRDLYPQHIESWHSWSWAQLRRPTFSNSEGESQGGKLYDPWEPTHPQIKFEESQVRFTP